MSDSDSDTPFRATSGPSVARLTEELRSVVRDIKKREKLDELTVNNVRHVVEARLGLEEDFLKSAKWKDMSKNVIREEAVRYILPKGRMY